MNGITCRGSMYLSRDSDVDGVTVLGDLMRGMPQPDGLAAFVVGNTTYVATANEGDARENLEMELGEHGIEGNPFVDAQVIADMSQRYGGADPTDEEILGRLGISTIDTDTDGGGDIDIPTTFGTRSFSIWDAETGQMVYDSAATLDSRSDNKGSEPEGLVLGEIGQATFAFIGLERTGGIMMYDVTDPENVSFVDYINTHAVTESRSPEGLAFISGDVSPDGANYLVVGYDRSDSIEVFRVVPEPSASVLAVLAGLLLLLRGRHMRARC